jgi:cytochrome c6
MLKQTGITSRSNAKDRNTGTRPGHQHTRYGILFAAAIALGLGTFATKASAADVADGEKAFQTNCVVCHGADGTGTPTGKALKAPDLHSDQVQKMTDAQIADQIANGKNNMPPFKSTLSKDQIQSLVLYVRTFGKKK